MLFGEKVSSLMGEKSSRSSEDASSQQPFLSDELGHVPSIKPRSTLCDKASHFSILGGLVVGVLMTLIITIALRPQIHTPRDTASVNPEQILECGTSREEAQYRGCVFDVMHYSWTPAPCYNATLSQMYWDGLTTLDIEFWNDTTKRHVLPYNEILAGQHEYIYTSWLLHLKHCQYLLNRQIQALVYGLPLDNLLRNASHAEHCLEEIRHPPDVKTMLYSGVAYLKCASGLGDIGKIYRNDPPASVDTLSGH